MVSVSQAFPPKYINTASLKGQEHTLTIERVSVEEVGLANDRKLVIYFQNAHQGFVLGVTKANMIAAEYGDDTDGWIGRQLILYPGRTTYQGKVVDAIAIRFPEGLPAPAPAAQPAPQPAANPLDQSAPIERPPSALGAEIGDDIPF